MSLIPTHINLTNGSNVQTISNDGTHININDNYELPSTVPSDNQIMLFQSNKTSAFVNLPSIVQNTYNYYVSSSGNNSNVGSIVSPFLTIGGAMTAIASISDIIQITINLASGSYNESVNITRNNTYINGPSSIPSQCVINGSITFNITSTSNIVSGVYALTCNNIICGGSGTNTTSLVLGACYIQPTNGTASINVNATNSVAYDLTISNTIVSSNTNSCLTASIGRINCVSSQFTQVINNNTSNLILLTSNALITLLGCLCLSSNNTSTAPAIIKIFNSVSPSSSGSINTSNIIYSSSTIDTGNNKCCIQYSNTVGVSYSVLNNLMISEGSRFGAGSNYQIVQKIGGGSVVFLYSNNVSGTSAHTYSPSLAKSPYILIS